MNKKEISEIKKQFTPENCSLTRICGCYVDGEKNKKTELKEAFLSLSEEEMFKYFEARRTKVFYSQIRAMCRFYGKKNVRKYKKL